MQLGGKPASSAAFDRQHKDHKDKDDVERTRRAGASIGLANHSYRAHVGSCARDSDKAVCTNAEERSRYSNNSLSRV